MKRLSYYLIEFLANYRKKCGGEVAPNAMRNYIFGIQRYFACAWGYGFKLAKGHVFAGTRKGLLAVLEKLLSNQQAREMTFKSHNVLTHDYIYTLCHSKHLSKALMATYQFRMIFRLTLLTAMNPTELHKLNISQSQRIKQGELFVLEDHQKDWINR